MNRTTPVSIARCSAPCSRHWVSFLPAPGRLKHRRLPFRSGCFALLAKNGRDCAAGDETLVRGTLLRAAQPRAVGCAHRCGFVPFKNVPGARQLPAALEGFAAAKTGQEALAPGRPRAPKLFFGGLGGIVESWSERRG